MAIIRWRPFRDWEELFEDFSVRFHTGDLAADVYEDNNVVIVEMNIPGIDPDQVDIKVNDTLLHVSGSREEKEEVEDAQYYRKEIRRGNFERTMQLPCEVIAAETRAELTDGVLRIMLPKAHTKEKKSENIKVTRT